MSERSQARRGNRIPVIIRAIVGGLLVGMLPANVWLVFLVALKLPVPLAMAAELLFLGAYLWWVRGGGPPKRLHTVRADYFRARSLSGAQWSWGLVAAFSFAVAVHSAIALLFRVVPYPAAAFRQGYDLSFVPTRQLQYLVCVISALSAGICEEVGFRGYMQRPIEMRHGALVAILISAVLFTLLHLSKGWALLGMVPIVFGAGLLLGMLARAAGTLWFGILGHWLMDIGLFLFWWTQVAGTFNQLPIAETGIDRAFVCECAAFAAALAIVLNATLRLLKLRDLGKAPPVGPGLAADSFPGWAR
jgi:membrane protease YdiL (CAAX protease family)